MSNVLGIVAAVVIPGVWFLIVRWAVINEQGRVKRVREPREITPDLIPKVQAFVDAFAALTPIIEAAARQVNEGWRKLGESLVQRPDDLE